MVLVVAILGIVMAIIPQYCVKKEFRDDQAQIKKMRISGIILAVLGIAVFFLLQFIR
ncbi:MAG: hypothetical protein J6X94_14510 [Lachnospiraceae bacterium]|nr:hypothetical protein [Lachnospiraceae bacterium]